MTTPYAPTAPDLPKLATLPGERLARMREAGREVLECRRVLTRAGLNIVGEVLRGQGTFYEYDHYPEGDVYDDESYSQYYYHAHREGSGEHGHFHAFLRHGGMPAGATPVAYDGEETWPSGDEALAHLVAISMDPPGWPIGLFATNRWVTAETWYAAADMIEMLPRFAIDHANPSWPTNRWITAMLVLYGPYLEALLRQRDQVIETWRRAHPGVDVYEDRNLEITGYLPISVETQIADVAVALAETAA